VNRDNLFSLFADKPITPGDVFVFNDYDGICDNCRADAPVSFLPIRFVGAYEDLFGIYWLFETMFYYICPTCRKDISTITLSMGGINVSANGEPHAHRS
jgi:hypothetical protein